MSPELYARFEQVVLQRVRVLAPLVAVTLVASLALSGQANIPETRETLAITAGFLLAVIALSGLALLRRLPARWAHAAAAAVWTAPVATSLCSLIATGNSRLFVLLLLEMMCGFVMLSSRWLAASFLVFDAAWLPIAIHLGGNDVVFHGLTLAAAQTFAFVIHRLKVQSLVQAEQHRIEAEARVAELSRSEAARGELSDQLVHSQRLEAIGTLAAGLAHDMNNVLAAIMGLAGNLAEDIDDRAAATDLAQIVREAERGAELTRGLLTFSRRGQYRKEVLPIGAILDDVVTILGRTLPKAIEIEKQVRHADACVEGDPTQFQQALLNLGINAADAMNGKGHLLMRAETVEMREPIAGLLSLPPGNYARLTVVDTGSGMDEKTRARVFEPFFTTKPMGKGTGLGLALVWGVAAKALGTVTVDSELNKGTTFSIYLPLTAQRSQRVPTANPAPRVVRTHGTVLVVDDEPAVRRATTRMLERLGWRTLAAADGEQALALYDQHADEIGLVVLDMGMPGMTGSDVFRELRMRSKVNVLIATGYAVEEEVQSLVTDGARVLEKPFKLAALELEVERALRPVAQA
ncbi:MAG TPA: response regulator [Kofleriaceae bacterium]|jgi:signal transduction histidine kinase/CheY-like chemotaxis protein|nr:response regulator [Kofleriaceae bacterium]